MTDVSIIIVSWNTRELLRTCVSSVLRHSEGIFAEVIVVDNASHDGSAEMVAGEFPCVHLIRNERNRGFAAANNQAMEIARGRYVLLLNSDTLVFDGAIGDTVAYADRHAKAGIVACKIVNEQRQAQHEAFLYPSLLNTAIAALAMDRLFPRNHFFGRERMKWRDLDEPMSVPAVAGCFMLVRREALDDVGPMDTGYFMFAEETDWCWRMRKHGWQVLYYPNARIMHYGGASTAPVADVMHLEQRRSVLAFISKREGDCVAFIANLLMGLGVILRLPVWAVQALPSRRGSVNGKRRLRSGLSALRLHLGLGRVSKWTEHSVIQL